MAAIYQWFVSGEFLFTTTVYPIEALDQLNWSASISGGATFGVAQDAAQFFMQVLNGELEAILYTTGIQNDDMDFTVTPLDSAMDQILFSTGIDVDELQFAATPIDSTMDLALVKHDVQPYEALDLAAWVTGGGTF